MFGFSKERKQRSTRNRQQNTEKKELSYRHALFTIMIINYIISSSKAQQFETNDMVCIRNSVKEC